MKQTNFIRFFVLLCVLFLQAYGTGSLLRAQSLTDFECGTDDLHQELLQTDPDYYFNNELYEEAYQYYMNNNINGNNTTVQRAVPYTIPVVIHLVSPNAGQLLNQQEIEDGLSLLNAFFAGTPCDAQEAGIDTEIQLCLAKRMINNDATNGINYYTDTELSNHNKALERANLMALTPLDNNGNIQFPTTDYLNVWIVNEIYEADPAIDESLPQPWPEDGLAGYSTLAPSHGNPFDGFVIESQFWTGCHNAKVSVHELGHYLNLQHTFHNGAPGTSSASGCINTNCLTYGDFICDTPPDNNSATNSDCGPMDSCPNDNDFDLRDNYMDYGQLVCHTSFTVDQKERMLFSLDGGTPENPSGIRASLLSSEGCIDPCPNPIIVSFTASESDIVNLGTTVIFTNTTLLNTYYTFFDWFVDGTLQTPDNDLSYLFNELGNHTVELVVGSNEATCTEQSYSMDIEVVCPVDASFEVVGNNTDIQPNTELSFISSLDPNIFVLNWYVENTEEENLLANGVNELDYTFVEAGYETIYLEVCTTIGELECCDIQSQFISIGNCNNRNHANIWYFGVHAGLDFNEEPPAILTDGQTFNFGGYASISDENGNLLFYTDSETIWDRNHNIMETGLLGTMGTGLLGTSNLQSALIVPEPESDNRYYIFTVGNNLPPTISSHYTIIDMNSGDLSMIDGLPLGAVDSEEKNIPLWSSAEAQQTAVLHCNGKDIWILNSSSQYIHSYLLTSNGIATNPSGILTPFIDNGTIVSTDLRQLKVNSQGTMLASTRNDFITLASFDNATGEMELIKNIDINIASTDYKSPFGVEFSPNGKLLYTTAETDIPPAYPMCFYPILQYDLTSQDIENSSVLIETFCKMGSLQLAPNGKIYKEYVVSDNVGAINFPNNLGAACEYDAEAIPTLHPDGGTHHSLFGLPNIFYANFDASLNIIGDVMVCTESPAIYALESEVCSDFTTYEWTISPTTEYTIADDNTTGSDIELTFSIAGSYELSVKKTSACGAISQDMLTIEVQDGINFIWNVDGKPTEICEGETVLFSFTASNLVSGFYTDTSTDETFTLTASQVANMTFPIENISGLNNCFELNLTDSNDCNYIEEFCINAPVCCIAENLANIFPLESTICQNQTITLTASNGETYEWSSGITTDQAITVSPTQTATYTVTVTDANGCTDSEQATVNVTSAEPSTITPNLTDLNLCQDASPFIITCSPLNGIFTIDDVVFPLNELGQFGFDPANFTVGTYTVSYGDEENCIELVTETIEILSTPTAEISLNPNTNTICEGEQISLTASGAGVNGSYLWNNGNTNTTIAELPTTSTVYRVTITDSNGCTDSEQTTVSVISNIPPTITPNLTEVSLCASEMATIQYEIAMPLEGQTSDITLDIEFPDGMDHNFISQSEILNNGNSFTVFVDVTPTDNMVFPTEIVTTLNYVNDFCSGEVTAITTVVSSPQITITPSLISPQNGLCLSGIATVEFLVCNTGNETPSGSLVLNLANEASIDNISGTSNIMNQVSDINPILGQPYPLTLLDAGTCHTYTLSFTAVSADFDNTIGINLGVLLEEDSDINNTFCSLTNTATQFIDILSNDLEISKTVFGNNSVSNGDNVTYSISVTNHSDNDISGVSLQDVLPSTLNFVSADNPLQSTTIGNQTIVSLTNVTIPNNTINIYQYTAQVNNENCGEAIENCVSLSNATCEEVTDCATIYVASDNPFYLPFMLFGVDETNEYLLDDNNNLVVNPDPATYPTTQVFTNDLIVSAEMASTIWSPNNHPLGANSGYTGNNLNHIRLNGDLVIPSGISLTMTDLYFDFGPNGRIIVLNDATLTLNNCKMIGDESCKTMWQGIRVVNETQNNPSSELFINDTEIYHALVGVATCYIPKYDLNTASEQLEVPDNLPFLGLSYTPHVLADILNITAQNTLDEDEPVEIIKSGGRTLQVTDSKFRDCFQGINITYLRSAAQITGTEFSCATNNNLLHFPLNNYNSDFLSTYIDAYSESGIEGRARSEAGASGTLSVNNCSFTNLRYGVRTHNFKSARIANSSFTGNIIGTAIYEGTITRIEDNDYCCCQVGIQTDVSLPKIRNNSFVRSCQATETGNVSCAFDGNSDFDNIGVLLRANSGFYLNDNEWLFTDGDNSIEHAVVLSETGGEDAAFGEIYNNLFQRNRISLYTLFENSNVRTCGNTFEQYLEDAIHVGITQADFDAAVGPNTITGVHTLGPQGFCDVFTQQPASNDFIPFSTIQTRALFFEPNPLGSLDLSLFQYNARQSVFNFLTMDNTNLTPAIFQDEINQCDEDQTIACVSGIKRTFEEIATLSDTQEKNKEIAAWLYHFITTSDENGLSNIAVDSLNTLFNITNTAYAQRLAIDFNLSFGNASAVATALANFVPTTAEEEAYLAVSNIKYELLTQSTSGLTTEQLGSLLNIAQSNYRAAYAAQALLYQTTGYQTPTLVAFPSTAITPICAAPTNLNETNLSCNSVTLNWDAMPNAEAYQLAGRKLNGTVKVFPETQNTSRTFTSGLQSNTTYQWSVKTKCNGVWTDYTMPIGQFTTPTCKNSNYDIANDPFVSEIENYFADINLYPNPAKDELHINFTSFATEKLVVSITDILGKTVLQQDFESKQGANNILLQLDKLQAGYYFLMIDNKTQQSIEKFMVW